MPSASKPRARLTEAQVIAIFQAKASASSATKVAVVYGVSEKAVRDIWTGRTWSRETWHLDMSRPLQVRLTGRPKGRKDSKPRKSRANRHERSTSTELTSQVPCRSHGMHGGAGYVFEQDSLEIQTRQQENRNSLLSQSTDPAAYFDDSNDWHRSTASSTLYHVSVDEQLHEWDGFWLNSAKADPFSGDWHPC